ncbi:MAG: hypothetical protein WCO71_08020, partial [Pseudomonadota bacterium]
IEVTDKTTATPDAGEAPANATLLPGAKAAEINKEAQEVLDDDGRVIKGDETPAAKSNSVMPPATHDDPGVDVNGQQKPETEKSKSDNGDLW